MIDTDKYEGHDEDWKLGHSGVSPFVHVGELTIHATNDYLQEINMGEANAQLIADAPLLLEEVKRLRKALHIEQEIVQAFYEYRDACCFDHCEAWMLENGHRVMVKIGDDEQSEWKVEVE